MSELSSLTSQEPASGDEVRPGRAIGDLPPKTQLNINSVALLENVSNQLLKLLTTSSIETLTALAIPGQDFYEGEVFETLFALFKQVKKVYTELPLLNVRDVAPGLWLESEQCPYILKTQENLILAAIRKANIVTYLLSIMGRFQYGFSFLDDNFIDIFCPEGKDLPFEADRALATSLGRLLKPQAVLYLNLKTQAYISALEPWKDNPHELPRVKQETLNQVFAPDVKDFLLAKKRLRSSRLSPSEEDFIKRCAHRREKLAEQTSLEQLISEYDWLDFFKEVFFYVQRNVSVLVWGKKGIEFASPYGDSDPNTSNNSTTGTELKMQDQDQLSQETPGLASDSLAEPSGDSEYFSSSRKPSPTPLRDSKTEKKPKQKRLWTKDEEAALVDALKSQGPAWSKILELHGAGGSVSELLKRRTQVQLKDKARNWKMYFLKGGLPVPDYLTKVTGDLERDEKSRQRFKNKIVKKPTQSSDSSSASSPSHNRELRRVATLSVVHQEPAKVSKHSQDSDNNKDMDPELQAS
ncbi:LANO_0H14642g1_1 [Lachancea nothofagi CBS 11611]|uniref:LANO_0H14642g1_1 n=1 Tax=Lachancea nothofagi CBS 11611 TaxID=1266666 RepID=A0A1G4KMH9_9SACH|nr:LANO_0H14642g1_1 [Lachancea nothofagi CBS 11611]